MIGTRAEDGGRFAKRPYLGPLKHKQDNEYMQIYSIYRFHFFLQKSMSRLLAPALASVTNKGKKIGCACGAPYGVF